MTPECYRGKIARGERFKECGMAPAQHGSSDININAGRMLKDMAGEYGDDRDPAEIANDANFVLRFTG